MIRSFGKRKKKIVESKSLEDDKDPAGGRTVTKCFTEIKRMMEARKKVLTEGSISNLYFLRTNKKQIKSSSTPIKVQLYLFSEDKEANKNQLGKVSIFTGIFLENETVCICIIVLYSLFIFTYFFLFKYLVNYHFPRAVISCLSVYSNYNIFKIDTVSFTEWLNSI